MEQPKIDIVIENPHFKLIVGSDCIAKSLIYKDSGEECLTGDTKLPLFSVTQERPFNNEIKLAYPCKRTTFQANCLRREGNQLIVGFQIAPYKAVVSITEQPEYVAFSLDRFIVGPEDYGDLKMDMPPVEEFCLLQLPVTGRKHFGDWLNVSWDEKTAVNVLATAPETLVDADNRGDYRIMHAKVCKDIRLKGPGAALIVRDTEHLLDAIAAVEDDFGLPKGVESRRSAYINASIYWTNKISPKNVDEHIRFAKTGGFRMMLINYRAIYQETAYWGFNGNCDYRPEYPNGRADVVAMLEKIKAAGLIPGIHFLHTHIGMKSRYVTPVADHRLCLIRHFTLAKELQPTDTTIYVEQNTVNTQMADRRRVLQFGGELITYEGYTTEPPYCFTGCVRGAFETVVQEHPLGQIGGLLDVSEFGGCSVYLDQNSSLAEEIANKWADTYNCGFQFVYFDGSEGTSAPFAYNIPNAQYRVYKKMQPEPLMAEGAAKAHFSWHMLSGGNAFDLFGPKIFKAMIAEHPAQEAPRMKEDFTRVDFGWWGFFGVSTQADLFEYGTSRAAAWDCPATMQADLEAFRANPRFDDVFEVLRRWEDVRATNWLTQEQKTQLQNLQQEHILLINEKKEYELVPYNRIADAARGNPNVSAFAFQRGGESYVVYWHHSDTANLKLPLPASEIVLTEELYEQPVQLSGQEAYVVLPIDKRRYVRSKLPMDTLIRAFQQAEIEKESEEE